MPFFLNEQQLSPALIGQAAGRLTSTPSPDPAATYPMYGLTMRFKVDVLDLADLGNWSSCQGLRVDFKVTTVSQGGDYFTDQVLPDRVDYGRISLERAVRTEDSLRVQNWLKVVKNSWVSPGGTYTGQDATIALLDARYREVMTWRLHNVFPVSWTGPGLNASGNTVATEKLDLRHEGFL